ncbi:MAG TPA: hypothetical protein VLJ11_18585 [Bryobacteraceae bacterium]|nr:hypothetical protein [Bryobacteraceae bacterium]
MSILKVFRPAVFGLLLACLSWGGQQPQLQFLNHNRPVLDAHNCYPTDGQWRDRIDRALRTGFPVGIEQDLAWYVDPATGKGRVVVSHTAQTNGSEPTLRAYFFDRVRPIMEKALSENHQDQWPLIVLHFDFKDNQPALLHAVWDLLADYQSWMVTAPKRSDPHDLAPMTRKPLLVLTEDSDAQEEVFFHQVPVGSNLRLFGSAHTNLPKGKSKEELVHLQATLPADQLLTEAPTDYRRWWNNSWYEVEEGGEPHAGDWTPTDAARLRALVDRAHDLGYWIRFYTLDGFSDGTAHGWSNGYNFGSLQAARLRWRASMKAGVNLVASDQYEDLAETMGKTSTH